MFISGNILKVLVHYFNHVHNKCENMYVFIWAVKKNTKKTELLYVNKLLIILEDKYISGSVESLFS